ncbi:MAG: (Fe-S)-binding protein [Prevotellaceae bacterium]|jgi:L-lactate dehydrogenase complex protein LldE|nr:(Fe-S)-binding protein [Prevotellaceae bacterium]
MKIGLFIPCYVNALFPEAGVATYRLLNYYGVDTDYPLQQTCCGQPMANAGFESEAVPLLQRMDNLFSAYDYVVAPSASCVAFVKTQHVCQTSTKIYDVCEFLHDVLNVDDVPGCFPHKVSVHNSCHGVRELHLSSASELNETRYSKIKDLLAMVEGIEVLEPRRVDECCGFGGMFAVEEPSVSVCMGKDKLHNHIATGAEYITGADSSCLMHLQGIARREQLPIQFIHVTQILAAGL